MDSSFCGSTNDDPNIDLSSIEKLPCELFTMIIECVPESILPLRLTSKLLKSRVEGFILDCSLPLVEILEIEDYTTGYRNYNLMKIELTISTRNKPLFDLRYKLLENNITIKNHRSTHIYNVTTWKFEWDTRHVEDSQIGNLRQLIGRSVKQVKIEDELSWEIRVIPISKLLDNLHFTHLKVDMEYLTDDSLSYIKTMIGSRNIEHFHISVLEVNTTQNGEQILLELSSVLRTLHIYQHDHESIERSQNYMFGIYDANWAQLIPEMFSRKLDRLDIESQRHARYLTRECRNHLMQQLPLADKKIWFRGVTRSKATIRQERNGFLVEIDDFHLEKELRVRHSSRLNEKDDLFYFYRF